MMGSKGKVLRIVVSFIAIFLVVYSVRGKIAESLSILRSETEWGWFGAAVAAYFVGLAIIAVRLKWVFRVQDVRMGFRECYYLGFVGLFYNLFLPSAVGGDIARAFYAYKRSGKKIESATSVLIDRLLGFVATITMAVLGLLCFSTEAASSYIDYAVYGALGLLTFCIAFLASKRFARLFKGVARILPGQKWKEKVSEIYQAIYGYRHHHGPVLVAVLLSFLGQAVFITSNYWLSRGIGADIEYWKFFILIPVISIVSMAPSIGGLGVREASVLYLFSRYLPSERALAYTLLIDILIYGFSIGSGIVYAFRGGLKQKDFSDLEVIQSKME